MIKLKKLRFKNIGRFVEMQEISFEDLSNLVQIDGKNNNTGGSSGAAKSTVFNAHDFLLGLNSIPNSQLQSRLIEESIFVEGEYDYNGKSLIISRGKKLKISVDGEITAGSSKLAEEKLDEILGIPRNLFRVMLHKKQGERGFFLGFTPAETNSFLTDCLGLGDFKNNIDSLDVRIDDLSKMITSLSSDLTANNSGLEASQDAMLALGKAPVKDVDQNTILTLKNHLDVAVAQYNTILDKHKDEIKSLESRRPKLESVVFDSTNLKKHEKDLGDVQAKIAKLRLEEKDQEYQLQKKLSDHKVSQLELKAKIQAGINAREEAKKAAGEILKVRNSICPRCEQSWINESVKAEEAKLLDRINELKNHVLGGEHAAIQLEVAQEALDYELSAPKVDHTDIITGLEGEEKSLRILYLSERDKESEHTALQQKINRDKLNSFADEEKILRQIHNSESAHHSGQVDICRRSFEASAMKLRNYEDVRARYDKSLNTLMAQEQVYANKMEEIAQSLKTLKKDAETAEELKRAIKSYLSCSFDEALEVISENATKMIQNIPNMANSTIQLEGTKETKEGKVKEEVNFVIHMDGEENIPIKTLSGGERAAVDIAIDIAVLGLIEDRTNKGIDVFVLDEPFTGLEGVNIEMVLEVLKNANTHKKLIVVDHNPVVKEQISDRITIVRDGLISKVT